MYKTKVYVLKTYVFRIRKIYVFQIDLLWLGSAKSLRPVTSVECVIYNEAIGPGSKWRCRA